MIRSNADSLMFKEHNYTPSQFTLLGDGDVTQMEI